MDTEQMKIWDKRLYYNESYLFTFEGKVIEQTPVDGKWLIRLNQTAFYPTSGGQPHDLGQLGGALVQDVFVQDGEVYHLVDRPLPIGTTVVGEIDRERRIDHMQQHTGQHILSACFEQKLNVDTVGFHLGAEYSTVDIHISHLEWDDILAVEQMANQIVLENRPITATFTDPLDLPNFHLRHAPKVENDVRIVSIAGFDHNACGGTHPNQTGEVGQIKIIQVERVRSDVRLTFVCGNRALNAHEASRAILHALSKTLSTSSTELISTVARLQNTILDLRKSDADLKQRLAAHLAKDLAARITGKTNDTVICTEILPDLDDVAMLKAVLKEASNQLADRKFAIALIAPIGDRVHVHVATSTDSGVAANEWLKVGFTVVAGKGGGTAVAAQGSAELAHQGIDSATKLRDVLRTI